MHWGRRSFAVFLLSGALGAAGQGASAVSTPPTGLAEEFSSLASRAATIFVGQVISIERRGGAVEIVFSVEQAVLGAPGSQYTLREWAGLWPQGQFRYTVGQRALLFLHGASAAGFGSPVDGAEGVVPVIVGGADAPELLDVRRLSTALVHGVGTPPATEANGAIQLASALPLIAAGIQTAGGRMPRLEPVRLPMPVHSGLGAGFGGRTGVNVEPGNEGVLTPLISASGPGGTAKAGPVQSGEPQPLLRATAMGVPAGGAHEAR